MRAPAFQFYPDDFIGGTCDLSQAEVGAYVRLLCYQWGRGEIPKDKDKRDRVAGGPVSDDILAKFPDGKNPRLEAERQKQVEWREKCSAGGKRSAESRRVVPRVVEPPLQVTYQGKGQVNGNSPSPSPSPLGKEKEKEAAKPMEPGVSAIPSVDDAVFHGAKSGIPPDFCRKWHKERESERWADANGLSIGNWRRYLNGAWTRERGQKPWKKTPEKQGAPAFKKCGIDVSKWVTPLEQTQPPKS